MLQQERRDLATRLEVIFPSAYDRATHMVDWPGITEAGPDQIARLPLCTVVSSVVCNALQAQGVAAEIDCRYLFGLALHAYVRLPSPEGELIADGTWGQFLPQGSSYGTPLWLFGTREECINAARHAAVPEEYLALWLPKV